MQRNIFITGTDTGAGKTVLTALLAHWAGGWGGFVLFAEGDQLPVVKTWLVRLSLLPTVLVLAWRQVDRRV